MLIILVMVISSCGQASPTSTTPTTVQGTVIQPTNTPTTPVKPTSPPTATPSTPAVSGPKYGGVLTIIPDADTVIFDDAWTTPGLRNLSLTNEEVFQGDWTKGPAGTGEVTWRYVTFEGIQNYVGRGLAEKWELNPSNFTLTLNIRKGVYWHNKPPTNGRELTADDIAYSINRQWTSPQSYLRQAYPGPSKIETPDKWTVVLTYKSFTELVTPFMQTCDYMTIWPADAGKQFGDFRDWRNSIGTGPYMFTDYVKGASMTFTKNPNYWDTDPIGPGKGNKLPYLDGVKYLNIMDISTQMAAMRTGKADYGAFQWENAATLKKSNPELMSEKAMTVSLKFIWLRTDNPDFPWSKLKVRQAMHMAVDYNAILKSYYGNDGDFYNFPAPAIQEASDYRVPFKELPQNVQELFSYQPDKAKQMLTEAGYAKGFDLEVVCEIKDLDLLSIYKDYFSKIGVNLIMDPKELAVFTSIGAARTHKHAYFGTTSVNVPFHLVPVRPASASLRNWSMSEDKLVDDAWKGIWDNFLDWNKRCKIFKDITPHIIEQCYGISSPSWYNHFLWQPWLKNFHGELTIGMTTRYNWAKWVWLDQDLKEKMTGSR